jgi:hypothetical protein
MSQRERLLAATVGLLLAVAASYYVWEWVAGKFRQRRAAIVALEDQIEKLQLVERKGQRALRQVRHYQMRSLPENRELARGLYQEWLLALVTEVGLAEPTVDSLPGRPEGDVYYQLIFRVAGQGTLEQISQLLHRFYAANHLHRIGHMVLNPQRESKNLSVELRIEALAVTGAEDRGSLSTQPSERLALDDLSQYTQSIVSRSMFAPANQPPKFDRIADREAPQGERLELEIKAKDPDSSDKLTYRLAEDAPKGAQIDERSGRLRWTPQQLGTYQFTVQVSDNGQPNQVAIEKLKIKVVEPRKRESNDAEFTFVTGIVHGDEALVWIEHRMSGQRLKLKEGDQFKAGQLEGSVRKIRMRDADLVLGDEILRVPVGKNLRDAAKVPPDGS